MAQHRVQDGGDGTEDNSVWWGRHRGEHSQDGEYGTEPAEDGGDGTEPADVGGDGKEDTISRMVVMAQKTAEAGCGAMAQRTAEDCRDGTEDSTGW